ncbi:MAG TPA: hypothetical protein VML75_28100, partial [Kofleriaceae bacterium]|nr:hypothetical protein [Kofleriaceae bacterium]
NSTYETYQAIVAGGVPTPSSMNHELDPALDPVIMRSLAYKKEDRYPTAEAFGEALLKVLHERGKSVSPSDVARFFDEYFQQEIEEYGQRMRELIEGRTAGTIDELAWDLPDAESDAAARMPDESQNLDRDFAELGGPGDDDENEATRIELNPLERMQALHDANSSGEPSRGPAAVAAKARPARRDSSTSLGKLGPLSSIPVIKPPERSPRRTVQAPAVAPPPTRPAPPGGPPPARAATDAPRGRGAPPRSSSPSQPPPLGPAPAAGSPGPTATPEQRTMFGGAAPTPEQIQAAAREADQVLGQQRGPVPTVDSAPAATADQRTMLAGNAPTAEEIAAAARHADQVMGAQPQPQPYPLQPQPQQQPQPNRDAFPPINTPTAFRSRGELIADGAGFSPSGPAGDLAALASERERAHNEMPAYVLVFAFIMSAAVGLGVTVVIGLLL